MWFNKPVLSPPKGSSLADGTPNMDTTHSVPPEPIEGPDYRMTRSHFKLARPCLHFTHPPLPTKMAPTRWWLRLLIPPSLGKIHG